MTPRNTSIRRLIWEPAATTVMLVASFVTATPARSAIIYDNGTPSLNGGFLSDDDTGFRFADDFILAGPSVVNAVRFWGVYSPTDTPTAPDDFSIIFYGDGGGLPDGGNVIASFSIGDAGRTDTGDVLVGGLTVFEYVAPFSDLALAADHYWVSVFNNTTADADDNWGWARHDFPGNDARTLKWARRGCTNFRILNWRFSF